MHRTLALITAVALAWPSLAKADPLQVLESARDAARRGDAAALDDAEKAMRKEAAGAGAVIPGAVLGRMWATLGAGHWRAGDRETALLAWRQAFVFDLELTWEDGLVEDPEARSLFEAVRQEIGDRPTVSTAVPAKVGRAKLFVDGTRQTPESTVRAGDHLAQITCPDGTVHGVWSTFDRPIKWLKMCPGGVNTDEEPDEAPVDDEWGGLAPTFAPAGSTVAVASVVDAPPPERAGGGRAPKAVLLSTGGAALVAGAVANFALVNRTWSDIEDARASGDLSRAEADDLTKTFDTRRAVTLGLLGGGTLLVGTSVLLRF